MSEAELINLLNAKIRRLRAAVLTIVTMRAKCQPWRETLLNVQADAQREERLWDLLDEIERVAAEALEP